MRTHAIVFKLVTAVALAAGIAGCAPKIEPEIASSATEPMYAERFPAELQAAMEGMNAAETKSKEITAKFPGYPEALKSPPWAKVLEVYERADAGGRAYAYVEARREVTEAEAFFKAENEEILKKVAGAAQYAAKQKGCDADVSGSISHALKETVEKRLKQRLREQSEGNVYVERNQVALGKDNLEKLHEQADEIALASYLTHVAMVEHKVQVRRMIVEGEQVKATLDAAVRAEQAYQEESGRTPQEKKSSAERAESMRKSAASVDAALTQAKSVSEGADERVTAAQKSHDEAVGKLREDVKKRAGLGG